MLVRCVEVRKRTNAAELFFVSDASLDALPARPTLIAAHPRHQSMLTILLASLALDFHADVERAGDTYDAIQDATEAALVRGDLRAAQKQFLDAVPEKERTAAHYFVLGNLWFDMDPDFAFTMHERAFALAPKEPDVQREWALCLHRRGKFADAEPLYAGLPVDGADDEQPQQALRAECLLHLGRLADAAAAWKIGRASTPAEHVQHVLDWIHGAENPYARRARILSELAAGNASNAEELLLGDVFWRQEDEHYFVKYEYMEHDGRLAFEKLGAESERAKDLRAIVDFLFIDWEQRFPRRPDSAPMKRLREAATERRWLGDDARLPENSRVARTVIDALLVIETPGTLMSRHALELERRARAGDSSAFDTLLRIARLSQSPELHRWRELEKPDAVEAARAAVAQARSEKKPLAELLVKQIDAELTRPRRDLGALDIAFGELGKLADETKGAGEAKGK